MASASQAKADSETADQRWKDIYCGRGKTEEPGNMTGSTAAYEAGGHVPPCSRSDSLQDGTLVLPAKPSTTGFRLGQPSRQRTISTNAWSRGGAGRREPAAKPGGFRAAEYSAVSETQQAPPS